MKFKLGNDIDAPSRIITKFVIYKRIDDEIRFFERCSWFESNMISEIGDLFYYEPKFFLNRIYSHNEIEYDLSK